MDINVENNYDMFKKFLTTYIKREGIENLIKWLDSTDAKVAPASTKYHLCCEGGLIKHSLHVFYRLIDLLKLEYPDKVTTDENNNEVVESTNPYSKESIALVALLHDIAKINYYKLSFRNVKNDETGQWEKTPYYVVREEDDRLIFGSHAETSLYMVSKFFKLTYDEELAILYHMGGIDSTEDKITPKNVLPAFKKSPLAFYLHVADMSATVLDEANLKVSGHE